MITFRYQELSDAGIPRFSSYVGLRMDVSPVTPAIATSLAPTARTSEQRAIEPQAASQPIRVSAAAALRDADPTKEATSTANPAQSSPAKRYFEFVEGNSSKFWEVWTSGNELTTHWGSIGTAGQTKTKTFATPEKVQTERDKLVEEKLAKSNQEKRVLD